MNSAQRIGFQSRVAVDTDRSTIMPRGKGGNGTVRGEPGRIIAKRQRQCGVAGAGLTAVYARRWRAGTLL